jgi:hypothetical protein
MARLTGPLTLSDHPGDLVRLMCNRAGQYRKKNLIAQTLRVKVSPMAQNKSIQEKTTTPEIAVPELDV